jgi:hypothetical protein
MKLHLARSFEILAGTAAVLGAAYFGAWINQRDLRPQSAAAVAEVATPPHNFSRGFPQLSEPEQRDPREPEERAVRERATAIRRVVEAIQAEQQRAGGWDKWQADTQRYRDALKHKIADLRIYPQTQGPRVENQHEPLAGSGDFPLFECGADHFLRHLRDPGSLDKFRRDRPVVAAAKWLRSQGIDLIFVPLPRMTEVYVEHFFDPCPADGIIAPHVRRMLLEMLGEDVEVVDAFMLFRPNRDPAPDYLYNTTDPHWAPRAMRIMAKEIAGRIVRYKFGTRAQYAMPFWQIRPSAYLIENRIGGIGGIGWTALSDEQKRRAEAAQTTTMSEVFLRDGSWLPNNFESPVVVIGNSFVLGFREQLVKELNLLVNNRAADSQTTEPFADFLRDPDILAHTRVVVWITTEQHLTEFKPLPAQIQTWQDATGEAKR